MPIEETKKPLPLSSVATVVEDHPALRGDALLKQGEPGFILVVEKFPGANTLAVTRGVEAAMDELKPGLAGVTVDMTIFQPASRLAHSSLRPHRRIRDNSFRVGRNTSLTEAKSLRRDGGRGQTVECSVAATTTRN